MTATIEKSSIFIARVSEDVKTKLLEIIGYKEGELPIRYLGLPSSPRKWTKIECNQLCLKIIKRIKIVANKHLSYVGKLQLIISMLFSKHNFWGAVFTLPKSVVKKIDRKCRDYRWGSSKGKRKQH